jgi:hypothetical protein
MCGRAHLSTDFGQIKIAFRIPPQRPTPNFAPNYNLAPADPIPIVRYDAKAGERSRDVARWCWCRGFGRSSALTAVTKVGQVTDVSYVQRIPIPCSKPKDRVGRSIVLGLVSILLLWVVIIAIIFGIPYSFRRMHDA